MRVVVALARHEAKLSLPARRLDGQQETGDATRRRIEIDSEDVDVQEVRQHEDDEQEEEHGVLLHLVVGAQRLSLRKAAMIELPSSGGIGMRLKNARQRLVVQK